jgi:ATP-dependent Lon protease
MPPIKRKRIAISDTDEDASDDEWVPDSNSTLTSNRLKKQVAASTHCKDIKTRCYDLLRQYEQDPDNNGTGLTTVQLILQLPHKQALNVNAHEPDLNVTSILENSWIKMESAVYGHREAKLEILQYHTSCLLGVNSGSGSRVLGLVGPPGVGKTTLVVNGVSNALDLPFYQMSIGGLKDVTFFTGSLPCWKGSHQGVFADILIRHGHRAIVYIDEIDKVASETALDIYGWLTHAVDPMANKHIRDNFLGIDLDLSGLTFIFSYNDADMLPAPLRDRIKEVHLVGFTKEEKVAIAHKYIIPECLSRYRLTIKDIIFTDKIITELHSRDTSEGGVRKLKKLYESVIDRIMLRISCTKEGFNYYLNRISHSGSPHSHSNSSSMDESKGSGSAAATQVCFQHLQPIKSKFPLTIRSSDLPL